MAKKIMLFVLAFTLAAVVIFTGCTPARRPYNTNDQYNRTGQTGNANGQNDPALTNNWGTRDISYNNGTLNNGNGMGYNNGNGLGYNNGLRNNGQGNSDALGNNVGYNTTAQENENLVSAIEGINGVRNANVVVSGNTAYVGITLDNTANATNTNNIKSNVAQQVKTSNRNINTVYVSTDAGFINRLRNVVNGIKGGRPISGFTNELNNMVERITPNM
ncbi:MAG: putative sporulation lipoprotein YhcN/YlaJ [Clostridia bacterium]|jgi:YhcN/YlaJ family sporulation lipoprotein|nr:putative sporulation lipoprotein YhcN/YlaJ [Clostridia bacterium]